MVGGAGVTGTLPNRTNVLVCITIKNDFNFIAAGRYSVAGVIVTVPHHTVGPSNEGVHAQECAD